MNTATRRSIIELSPEALASWLRERDEAGYRAEQILKWVHIHQADRFDQMSNLPKRLQHTLAEAFVIPRLQVETVEQSADGSRKYLFRLADGHTIESVLIPEKSHSTLCISSQVGCAQGCRFCLTARHGFKRNLTAGEIIAQVRDGIAVSAGTNGGRLTNIVLMGMGEPLANYANVRQALRTIADSHTGLSISPRRITLSTAGLVPELQRLGQDLPINLAISLNATDNKTRNRLMPINRRYPVESLLAACRDYPLKPRQRITFEYILIEGVNDTDADALRLADLLRPVKAKINLIPFNAHPESGFQRPSAQRIERFQKLLVDRHYTAVIRYSKGLDISAACGQLYEKCQAPPGESGALLHPGHVEDAQTAG